jgi:sulfatase modifying factor 1
MFGTMVLRWSVRRGCVVLLLVSACRLGFDESPLDGRDGMPAVFDADLTSPDGSERCPSGRGPSMSLVPSGFCIDNHEVTKAQYQEFLDANTTLQTDGRCSFNTSYMATGYVWSSITDPNKAVAGVDWCDARDYCAWAGKRLCGKIGSGGLLYADHASVDSQWYMACSQGGMRRFSYGTASADTAVSMRCHLDNANNATGNQAAVGAYPECKIVGTNVVDMLGNVQEWIDACETNAAMPGDDRCKVVGGVWYFGASYSDCDFFDPASGMGIPRDMAEKHTGFRCCAD